GAGPRGEGRAPRARVEGLAGGEAVARADARGRRGGRGVVHRGRPGEGFVAGDRLGAGRVNEAGAIDDDLAADVGDSESVCEVHRRLRANGDPALLEVAHRAGRSGRARGTGRTRCTCRPVNTVVTGRTRRTG